MKHNTHCRQVHQLGSTLLELMVAIAILSVVSGAILSQLGQASQRIGAEQVKVDNFDEARDFVDQFFRDINQIGYPNAHIQSTAPSQNSSSVAVGLVKISATSVWFEGDINGSGVVQSVQYMINGSGTCTLCLQRSAVPKVTASPLTGQSAADWGTEVNDLTTTTIFTYFDTNGNQILATALPADIVNNPLTIASVKTIHISLTIQNNAVMDPKTHQPIQTSFEGEVSLNNCSMAAGGAMTC
jgi:prepilin-type N-terminal cleavage/methylation domain-containing protein